MMRHLCITFVLCALLALGALRSSSTWAGGSQESETKTEYEFELPESDRERLFAGIKQLRLGDTIPRAKQLLGEPTRERDLISKSTIAFRSEDRFRRHELVYYTKRVEIGDIQVTISPLDQYVLLDFDIQGHLRSIIYSYMEPVAGEVTRRDEEHKLYWTKPPTPDHPSKEKTDH